MLMTPRATFQAVGLFCFVTVLSQAMTHAQDKATPPVQQPANPAADRKSQFYSSTRVHQIHFDLTQEEWNAMAPVDSKNSQPSGDSSSSTTVPRPVHRNRFPWSVGTISIDGQTFDGAGVRYKGNASFNLMRGSLKRNLKVKLDWTDKKQDVSGIETINFNAGGLDPSKLRDALGYSIFRKAGLPASRTTYAEVALTVPGLYEKVHLGLFTLVEQVNKSFLKSRFGSSKGLLMKPEGVLSMDYRGEDWAAYESVYRPDDTPTPEQTKRVIEFAKLVNLGSEEEFEASIESYLDTEGFLRFIAVNALIVNLDTLLVMPQNYYLYLEPATNRFVFFPWDLDISFAGWPLGGPAEQQMQLSLRHPHAAGGHKLLDRLLSLPKYKNEYERIMSELVDGVFTETTLLNELNTLETAISGAIQRDKDAIKSRSERGYPAPRGYRPPSLSTFVQKRHASIHDQQNGESFGYVYAKPQPPFGRSQLALHVLVQGDTNQDRRLSKQELVTLFGQWFEAMNKTGKESLTKQEFVRGLPDALFPPDFPHKRPPRTSIPEAYVADGLFSALSSAQTGDVSKETMVSHITDWFDEVDTNATDRLDRRQLTNAFRKLIPH